MSDTNLNDASFTPEIQDSEESTNKQTYSATGSFRFWCQKVLPLVYDDSLSYYELLCKVVNYLNNVIQNVDNLNTSVDNTNTAFDNLQNYVNTTKDTLVEVYGELEQYVNDYFNNLDVQEEINSKLDAMASDGSLSGIISPFIPSAVSDWLSQHITPTSPAIDASLSVSGAGADAKVTGDKLSEIKSALIPNNATNLIPLIFNGTDGDNENVHFAYSDNGSTCKLTGTASGVAARNFIAYTGGLPYGVEAGKSYLVEIENATDTIFTRLFFMNGPNIIPGQNYYIRKNTVVTVPATGCDGLVMRIEVTSGTVTNRTLKYKFLNAVTNAELQSANAELQSATAELQSALGNGFSASSIPNGANLDNIKTIGLWFASNDSALTNYPYDSQYSAWLIVTKAGTVTQQLLIPYFFSSTGPATALNEQCVRRNFNGSSWSEWKPLEYKNNAVISSAVTTKGGIPNNTNLDSLNTTGIWFASNDSALTNYPYDSQFPAWLIVTKVGRVTQQLLIPYFFSSTAPAPALTLPMKRRNYNGSEWSTWQNLGGSVVTNNYEFISHENTYNITATPEITSDTNNYLSSTGDNTDRTTDIATMLSSNGVCHLGPGDFYVKDLMIPNNSSLIGSGSATRLIMIGTSDGCAVQMKDYCLVRDLQIWGSASAITRPTTVGNRHGILWSGTWTEDETATKQPKEGIVSNVWIKYFTGGGITCYNTGFATYFALEVTNAYIEGCGAGINISYWSEFHKFTNVRTPSCLYGCINNGGNNIFVNCDFSTCTHALLMDNSNSQSPNNSHGSMIGCVFDHTNSDTGIGIKILNCDNGFVFEGCQIFFSQIDIESSNGVVISNSNFGDVNCNITIVGGGTVLFANNMHQAAPTINITDNSNVHFVNCYVRSTGASIGN